ncbi:MAG: hypothetical protein WC582_02815 [Patescibacteria group bacterium]
MENTNILARENGFVFIGWKSYNQIKKKAMEQEFSWSGLVISLSIAFFIVLISAQGLNIAYKSLEEAKMKGNFINQNIYYLESSRHLDPDAGETAKKFFQTKTASASEMSNREISEYLYCYADLR